MRKVVNWRAFQKALATRDLQSARDHDFRTKKLNHETTKSLIITLMAVAGIICSLYLIVVRKDTNVGTPLLVASFLSLGVKVPGSVIRNDPAVAKTFP